MNKRIRELAEQATTVKYGVDNGFDRVTFDKEKFAELIVRECANIAETAEPFKSSDLILSQFGLSHVIQS
jgi:hypothetical protein